jgi:metal-dependent amidase/aminoacylase/carboxypeptidase family protein
VSTPSSASSAPALPADWLAASLEERLQELLPELIQLRRHLHRHPELSGQEQRSAALVAGELRRWGWRVREAVGRTGVVAELGPSPKPLVAARVDMDGLPIEERTGLEYASSVQGLMHACGHDIHTSVGLGAAAACRLVAGGRTDRVHTLTALGLAGLWSGVVMAANHWRRRAGPRSRPASRAA